MPRFTGSGILFFRFCYKSGWKLSRRKRSSENRVGSFINIISMMREHCIKQASQLVIFQRTEKFRPAFDANDVCRVVIRVKKQTFLLHGGEPFVYFGK
ncbi:MAG: hypothetical protein K2P57_09060 [Burkholderiales bacterium]|nr:hypothetical protein [Burkholderiales bacterium]